MEEFSHFFEVKLEEFDGPIDLLLHLVKQNELPIERISLARVADQYLRCIEVLKGFDLEMAGEYLVIAATLVAIKSSVLLNEPVKLVEDEEGNLVDPHEELMRRLREAEVYKDGASVLGRRPVLGVDVFDSSGTLEGVDKPPVTYRPHDVILLGMAFKKLLEKAKDTVGLTIEFSSVSVVERMTSMLDRLNAHGGSLLFEELLGDVRSRMTIVASFVAMLELCKRQIVAVIQEGCIGTIRISLASGNALEHLNSGLIVSEFDSEEEASLMQAAAAEGRSSSNSNVGLAMNADG